MSAPLLTIPPAIAAPEPGDVCVDTLALSRGILCRARPWHHVRRSRTAAYSPRATPTLCEVPALVYENLPPWLERRPTKRGECPPTTAQCPWVSCRYHLAFDLKKRRDLRFYLPEDPELWPADAPTCALAVAEDGAHALHEVGGLLHITRERVRQLEQIALRKLLAQGDVLDLADAEGLDLTDARPRAHKNQPATKGRRERLTDPDLDGTYSGPFKPEVLTAKMLRIKAESHAPVVTLAPADVDLAALEAQIVAKRHGKPAPSPRKQSITINVFAQRAAQRAAKEAMQNAPTETPPGARLDRVGAPGEPSVLMTPRVYLVPQTPAQNPQNTSPQNADPVPKNETPPPTSTPCPPSDPTPSPIEMQPAQTTDATPSVPPISPPDDQPKAVEVAEAVSPTPPTLSRLSARSLRQHAKAASRTLRVLMVERRINRADLLRLVSAATSCAPTTVETSIDHLLAGAISPRSVWYRRSATALGVALSDLCADPLWVLSVVTEDVAHMRASHVRRTPKTTPQIEAAPQITAPQIEAAPPPPLPPPPPAPAPLEDLARAAQAALAHCVQLTADAEGLRAKVRDLETHNTYLRDRVASLEARLQRIAGEAKL